MKRGLLLLLLLAATGGLWAAAFWYPKAPAGLPERLQGTFRVYRIDPAEGSRLTSQPIPPGQSHYYTFRGDGSYHLSIRVSGDYEMVSREGVARLGERGILTLEQRSMNRRVEVKEPERYRTRTGQDAGGEFLVLERLATPAEGDRRERTGYLMYLRPDR